MFGSEEHFKNNLFGVTYGIVSDHKALLSVFKLNKINKTFSSRLLPLDFTIVHTLGRTLGIADYLSRLPSEYEVSVGKAEDLLFDWFTNNVVKGVTPELKRITKASQPIRTHEATILKQKQTNRVLTVHAPMQTNITFQQAAKIAKI